MSSPVLPAPSTGTWTSDDAIEADQTDPLGRLKTVTFEERKDNDTVSEQTKYRYDDVGNLFQVDLPGDIIQEYTYDALNRLVHLRHYHDADGDDTFDEGGLSPDPVLAEFAYTVDTDGQRSQAVETDDQGRTTTIDWVYDELGRLTEERYDAEGTANDFIARYAFDLASNRVKLSKDEENADRLLFAADEVTEYFYDANDRLTRETFDAATGDTTTFYEYDHTTQIEKTVYDGLHTEPVGSFKSQTTYEYNLQGRLEKIEIDSDGVGGVDERYTYKYNDAGIRVSSTDIADETTLYHVDSNNHTGYAQVLEEGVDDGDGRLQPTDIDTTYTLGHDVIAQQSDTEQGGQTLALLPDGHGSTRALITAALTLAEKYAYDAYGNMLPGAGLHTDPATALTSLLYSGEQTDPTGQQYLRARYYDPTVGRFNRLDPFAGNIRDPLSLHKYLYTHGNPVMGVDPSGLFSVIGVSSASSIGAGLNNITAMSIMLSELLGGWGGGAPRPCNLDKSKPYRAESTRGRTTPGSPFPGGYSGNSLRCCGTRKGQHNTAKTGCCGCRSDADWSFFSPLLYQLSYLSVESPLGRRSQTNHLSRAAGFRKMRH